MAIWSQIRKALYVVSPTDFYFSRSRKIVSECAGKV